MTEIKRDRFDRPLIIPPDGGDPVPYQRVTKFVDVLEDTFNLTQWQKRLVAIGIASRPDLQVGIKANLDDKAAMNRIADEAKEWAGSNVSSNLGTALHKVTERVDRGEEVPTLPEPYESDIQAFRSATVMLESHSIERFLVNDYVKAAGTADRLYDFGDRLVVGDTKTGSIEYGTLKIAMQLATYSRALGYDPDTGERTDLNIDQEWGIIVHLPAGTGRCELHWINLELGWLGVLLARDVRDMRKLNMKALTKLVDFEDLI